MRLLGCWALMLGAIVWCRGTPAGPPERRPPNILLFLADDQRADTIAAWGNRQIRTPHLDGLVRRGVSFRRNYCFGSNNGAVCVPSRTMLLSGRTWFNVRADLDGVTLLPQVLREAGYKTFATGKWHNGTNSFLRAFDRGRSVFFGGMADHTRVPVHDVVPSTGELGPRRWASRFSSEEFAAAASEFLRESANDAPFFCYVAFTAPHDPRNAPDSYRERLYRRRPSLPDNFLVAHPFDNGQMVGMRDEDLASWSRDPEEIRDQLAEYYALIEHLDTQVGSVLEALRRSEHAANTVVIYAADHGLALGSHGLLGKQSVYEHSMRCPLIIAGPRIPAGVQTEAMTYLFDLFPTLCAVAGAPPPPGLEGFDLAPLWRDRTARVRESVFLPFRDSMRAIRNERWKLIVYPQIHRTQLFDLRRDPNERWDLASSERHGGKVAELTELLRQWQRRVGDTQPLASPNPRSPEVRRTNEIRRPDVWQPRWIVEKYFGSEATSAKP
jgi:arylsulfatase A-like enzyme